MRRKRSWAKAVVVGAAIAGTLLRASAPVRAMDHAHHHHRDAKAAIVLQHQQEHGASVSAAAPVMEQAGGDGDEISQRRCPSGRESLGSAALRGGEMQRMTRALPLVSNCQGL